MPMVPPSSTAFPPPPASTRRSAAAGVLVAALCAVAVSPGPAAGQESRYHDCVALVEADLELGRTAARQWVDAGGGATARHCLAVADLKAGFPKLAAIRLQEVAARPDAGDAYVRSRILSQAATAWLEAEEPALAEKALDEAFALTPEAGELHLVAARVYGAQERWTAVVRAVKAAEAAGFAAADTFVLRGRAYAALGAYQTAAQDVVNALSLDPVNVDALVLRGELQQTGVVIDVFLASPQDETAPGASAAPEGER